MAHPDHDFRQSLVEDMQANQMQDAMAIWDGICSSQWFRYTPIVRSPSSPLLSPHHSMSPRVPVRAGSISSRYSSSIRKTYSVHAYHWHLSRTYSPTTKALQGTSKLARSTSSNGSSGSQPKAHVRDPRLHRTMHQRGRLDSLVHCMVIEESDLATAVVEESGPPLTGGS
jgi:hypothetical protein